jgi:5-methylcytosine-specific restriction endonuclease McrA
MCGRLDVFGQVDHKTPLHLGGAESACNRQWLCLECHTKKSEQEEAERQGNPSR